MKLVLYFLFLISLIEFTSCDILRFSQFEIVSWTPAEAYHSEPENIFISLTFSDNPHKASVERNFSLTGDGNRIRGKFLWEGKKISFLPFLPLEKNTDYIISLTSDARNTEGLSLDEAFNCKFTTRADSERPVLVSCYPSMYAKLDNQRSEVRLEFSLPVSLKTLYENVSFNPPAAGFWLLEDSGRTAVFTPAEPWTQNKYYEIKINSSLTDNNGMNVRNDFTSNFSIGTDQEIPYLLYAQRLLKSGELIDLFSDKGFSGITHAEFPIENHDWEKDDRLLLVFSKPVDSLSVKNYISIEDGPGLVMENSNGFKNEFVFKFDNKPVYGSRFTIRIKPGIKDSAENETKDEYIYKIFANGKYSKPPELAGIRIPMSPNNESNFNAIFFPLDTVFGIIPISDEHYPSGESVKTWIELYFYAAEGASVDLFSVMELFRTDTSNNVITFSPRQIKIDNFKITEHENGFEDCIRVEIIGNLTNSTNYGLINFQIANGLKDNLGNKNENSFTISLVK
ncbi:MAG: Ig-like domain-containing protein [Treponema sp.]|nr:Ig-like domain-containing protein [Treponema sp.]MCL2250617.1 Ig-like domain-containing protein [Treponema sp.]